MVTDNNDLVGEDIVQELFPVSMHVLAVDDNQVCLNMLENMLRKCHYKVTTTTESLKALEMLRENKDMFDLVICDVNMPEMDGFKLLKQVRQLEMDLPFIMLSGHGDTESVMKGVMNGASDYILKPIRMEEVQTIWQHVVRKKIDGKDQKNVSGVNNLEKKVSGDNNADKICNVARVCSPDTRSDQNFAGKDQILGRKRKERSDSEEDNDTDGSTEKKPRFVWDTESHDKFVAAVNQLGLDKAYPKKILELMKIEGLTRENVASHLQKFRLSLKRSDKKSKTDATFDSTGPYQQMGLIGGRRFVNSVLPSYGSGLLVSRLNTPSALNFRRMSYASVPSFQSRKDINCFQMPMVSANEKSCFSPDFRSSIRTNQFLQNNYPTGSMKLSSVEDPKAFTASSSFQSFKVNNANSSIPSIHHPITYNLNGNSFSCTSSDQPLTHNLEAITKHSLVGSAFVKNQSSNNTLDSVVVKTQSSKNTLDSVGVKTQSPSNTLDSVVMKTQSPNNILDSFGIANLKTKSQCMINPLDSAGGADVKTKSQSMINPLDSVKTRSLNYAASLAKPNSQVITRMPETEKFYTDPEAMMDSNDDCFYNHMLSLQPGFFDNSCVSLDDIYS